MMLIMVISEFLLANLVLCEVVNFNQQEMENNFCSSSDIDSFKHSRNVDKYFNLTLSYHHKNNPNQTLFPLLDAKKEIYSSKQFDYSYTFFYEGDKTQDKETIANLSIMGLTARLQSSIYSDLFIHHYDNFDELQKSGGPEANQELCLSQLKYLIGRSKQIYGTDIFRTKDVNYFRFIDSFGRRPSGLLVGNAVWLGVYDECLRSNLVDSNNVQIKTRYCMLNFKHRDWDHEDNVSQLIAIKTAACLPKSCDSINYKNKYKLIERLAKIAAGPYDLDSNFNISSLYCLPDEQSASRIWYYHPKVLITLAAFIVWISILLYSTYKYDQFLQNDEQAIKYLEDDSGFSLTEGCGKIIDKDQEMTQDSFVKIYKLLSIKVNTKKLFSTTNNSALLHVPVSKKSNQSDGTLINDINKNKGSQNGFKQQIVDLSNLEGIKVICMCYVILGHVLMTTTMIMSNGRDMASTTSISWFLANLTPAFAVNSFFSITGILTSYLLFKTKQIQNIAKKPVLWLGLIIYRYFRILPVYLIVTIYLKNISKFTGSGPLWDYGTSSLGQKRICENESIFWTILFGANFKSPFAHCVPSAWYLANDFQFFLITPIFITALYKNRRFGIKLLIYSIIVGYLAGVTSIYSTPFDNLEPIANFMPHGLKTYITFFEHNYTQPQYRVSAYLIGLVAGYLIYEHEHNKLVVRSLSGEFDDESTSKSGEMQSKSNKQENGGEVCKQAVKQSDEGQEVLDWPEMFKEYGFSLSAFCVTVCCITPYAATRLPFNKFFARFAVAIVMPTYHILFSLAIAIYIMLSSTGHGNKLITNLLSSPLWKPFARLSLCVVVTNIEVINYFIQTSKHTQSIDDKVLFVLNLSSIVVSYIVAIVVCILFEAPSRGILNLVLAQIMRKLTNQSRRTAET